YFLCRLHADIPFENSVGQGTTMPDLGVGIASRACGQAEVALIVKREVDIRVRRVRRGVVADVTDLAVSVTARSAVEGEPSPISIRTYVPGAVAPGLGISDLGGPSGGSDVDGVSRQSGGPRLRTEATRDRDRFVPDAEGSLREKSV